jgi:hypothetical protein
MCGFNLVGNKAVFENLREMAIGRSFYQRHLESTHKWPKKGQTFLIE